MKIRILFTVMLLLLGAAFQILAGSNIMKVKDATVLSGTVATIEVEIINDDPFAGFNFDIPLPTGFTYVEGTALLYRDNGHNITLGVVSGNVVRCISFAIPTTNFFGNEGVVVSFDVQTPSDEGAHIFNLENAVISNSSGNNILTATQPGTITLQEGLSGNNMLLNDVNAYAGSVITVEMEIINEDLFAGFNLDIPLPAGFTYVPGSAELYRANGHTLSFDILAGNVARALSFAIPTTNFSGNSGIVLSFDLQTPPSAGSHTLNITNAVITDSGGNNILTAVYPGNIVLQALPDAVPLDIKLILEGAYTPGETYLMQTALNAEGIIPLAHPFQPTLPYFGNNNPVWYYTGTETTSAIPVNAVDWVLLELRDASSPEQAVSGTLIKRMAAFLYKDGQIRTTAGQLPQLDIPVAQGLYVVVYHRNHLAVMSSAAVPVIDEKYTWNFTQSAGKAYNVNKTNTKSAYLQGHKDLGGGVFGMYGGDGDGNGQVQTQDKNEVWNLQSGQSGYRAGDFDLNGQVQTQDKNEIWNPNSGVASQVP